MAEDANSTGNAVGGGVESFSFGTGQPGTGLLLAGWSAAEDKFCWSVGTRSQLRLPMRASEEDTSLELLIQPVLPPGGRPRRLRLSVNGTAIGEDHLLSECFVGFRLPAAAGLAGGEALLTLETDPSPSPAELGLGGDTRALGFMLRSFPSFAPRRNHARM
jgi:hypothetical protein